MKKVFYCVFSLICSFWTQHLYAQNLSITNFNASPLLMNPANTGLMQNDFRLTTFQRNEYSYEDPSMTANMSFDVGFGGKSPNKNSFGIGLLATTGNQYFGKSSQLGLSSAYHTTIRKQKKNFSVLSFGVVGYIQNLKIDTSYLPSLPVNSAIKYFNLHFLDLNIGANWSGKFGKNNTYYLGASWRHVARPAESFILMHDQPKVNTVIALQGGLACQLNSKLRLLSSAQLLKNGPGSQLVVGSAFAYALKKGKPKAIIAGAYYKVQDALAPYISVELGGSKISANYDVYISAFQPAGKYSAYEIAYAYNGLFRKKVRGIRNYTSPRF